MLLIKEFAARPGLSELINAELQVKERQRGYTEAEAVLGLVYNLVLGGDCLSDLEVLRGDAGTLALLGVEQVLAPTTAGEHLRKFQIGAIWDLQRVNLLLQRRVRSIQDRKLVTIDLDSSIYEQASAQKEGSRHSYNGKHGYHPLFALCAETEQMLC